MNFIKVKKVEELKTGDNIAIATYPLESGVQGSISIVMGKVIDMLYENEKFGASIEFNDLIIRKMVLTNQLLEMQIVYKINKTPITNKGFIDVQRERIKLERKLEKVKKTNKKYRAMLIKRFGATDEEIDRNFKNVPKQKKSNELVKYKTVSTEVPYIYNGVSGRHKATVAFSSNSTNIIKCVITIYDRPITASAIAKCDKHDTFDKKVGEMISYNKAMAKIISTLH